MVVEFHTKSAEETFRLGREVGQLLRQGDRLFLQGDLGSGKTVFTQGVGQGLGVERSIVSPTFVILRVYQGRLPLYHMDLYRLNGLEDLEEVGWEELIYGDEGVVVVEWPCRMEGYLPRERLEVHLEHLSPTERKISFLAYGKKYEERFGRSFSWK